MIKITLGKLNRRGVIKVACITVVLGAIVTAWIMLVWGGQTNLKDPSSVAMKFVTEMQAVHPHSAYRLTSSGYHQEIPEALFTDSVVRDVAGQMSAAKPRLVSHSYPPEGSKATGQARIVVRIPRDEAVGDHTMQLLMIREGTANDQWYVQSFTLVNDSIGKDIPKDTPAK